MKIKIDLKAIKFDKIKKLPLIIAKHAFYTSLILFLLSLAIGLILFYKYIILAQEAEFEDTDQNYLLDEEAYKDIKKVWQEHENMLEQTDFKEYPNPFIESVPFPE
jgi:hypothetical protein